MPRLGEKFVGAVLLSFGILGIFLSDSYQSLPLAFIGLTLTFWGCLFLLVLSGKYVKSEVMDHMTTSSLLAVDQIIVESNAQGKPIYIPVRKESHLPIYLGTKNEFIYISKRKEKEETSIDQAFRRSPSGLRLTPPGLALAELMERKSGQVFQNLNIDSLKESLPPLITNELEIADDFKMSLEGHVVHVETVRPVCEDLCKEVRKMLKICPHIGCPVCSSIACILTRVTNKPIAIEMCSVKGGKVETVFLIL